MSGIVSLVNAFRTKTLNVRLKFLDLSFQALTMRPVLCRIDRLSFERRVFGPQDIHLATKPGVFGLDIFAFGHVPIFARYGRTGVNRALEVRSNT